MKLMSLNRCAVPDDLDAVTSHDPATEVDPESVGMTRQQVERIWKDVRSAYSTGFSPAITICLRRHGRVILNRAIGHARGNGPDDVPESPKVLATPDTRICLFSASKVVTAMLIHLLDERGEIDLLDPISYYIPEYGQKGKHDATIYHLLAHRGGVPTLPPGTDPSLLFRPKDAAHLLYEAKPIAPSGHRAAYHAITGGYILGEIIERVTGQTPRQFLQENICDPMGMQTFNYGLAPEWRHTLALNYSTGIKPVLAPAWYLKAILGASMEEVEQYTNDERFLDTICPAGNIYASAEETSRFFQMLLDGGVYQGKQIFDPRTIRRATIEVTRPELDRVLLLPMRYAMGPMLGDSPVGLYGVNCKNAFGHLGYISIFCWADPDRALAASVLTTGKSLIGPGMPAMIKLIAGISLNCKRLPLSERRRFAVQ